MSESKSKLDDDIDALFTLPLAEFTGARNALAARLKKEGRVNDAEHVKALAKPPVSAWTVNQLYWNHRDAFDGVIVTGERFRKAQTSRLSGKLANMREALDARREALTHLSDLAAELLQDAGHNPTQDMMRRITTTLEALSAYASLPNAPRAGRLTHDVDPPGFESLASMMPSAGAADSTEKPARAASSTKARHDVTKTKRKAEPAAGTRQVEDTRQTRIAAAKVSLQDSKRLLSEARARAQSAEAAQKKANAEVKEAEKRKQEAEELLDKTRTALQDATRRARSVATDVEKAAKAVEVAERSVEEAREALEKSLSV